MSRVGILARVRPPFHDFHVHTRHSKDVHDEAATFEHLAALGHDNGIAVGFADHFEATYIDKPGYCFREENIGNYMEEFDKARSSFPELSLGVEMEYFVDRPDLNRITQEWLDVHRGEFDRVLGSSHFVFGDWAVTWHVHMREVARTRSFEDVLEGYLEGLGAMIDSGLADCLAHADVVFRGNEEIFGFGPELRARGETEILELCRRALGNGMAIEVNLLGMQDGGEEEPSPSWRLVETLHREGARIFVGSDAHNTASFRAAIPLVGEACRTLERLGARTLY
jgi:HisJ family histidinol phosphate phosphatase